MKPDSSPSPDENAPSTGAGNHGQKGPQDLREQDLWDFADEPDTPAKDDSPPESSAKETPETDSPAEHTPQPVTLTPRGLRKEELPFRAKQPPKPLKGQKGEPQADETPLETLPVSIPKTPTPPPRKVEDAFDDLDSSEDSPAPSAKTPPKETSPTPISAKPDAPTEAAVTTPEAAVPPEAVENEPTDSGIPPESPAPEKPAAPIIPKVSVSKVEKIALISVLALLAIGSVFFIANSVYKIPEKHVWLKSGDFPIKGNQLEAVKAETYWRAPATGEGRIGTALLPVIDLELSGGPAAVRVFFRNAKGESAGDAFTKSISGETTLKIAGTAGFEDLGMHAAYRTTDTDRWIVEVYEGPSVSAPIESFKKLFSLPISTDRR